MAISRYEVLLLQKGKTQKQIAEEMGSHQSHISDWLNGHKIPNSASLFKLAKALDLTPEELLLHLKNIRNKSEEESLNTLTIGG